jgi:1-deoxy-D-xylulose-5-phosphate reductoisomerase
VLNAANEIAVFAFLRNRLGFMDMTDLVERTMDKMPYIENPSIEEYFESDGEARTLPLP